MKKRLFMLILAIAFIFASVAFCASAEEGQAPEGEPATGEEIAGVTGTPGATEPSEPAPTDPVADAEAKAEEFYSGWIDKITSSSLWVSIGSYATIAVALILLIVKKNNAVTAGISSLGTLVKGKADAATISTALADLVTTIRTELKTETGAVFETVKSYQEQFKTLNSALIVFITNTNIDDHTKTEILKMLSGISDLSEKTLPQIVEETNKTIEEAKLSDIIPDTPALSAVLQAAADLTKEKDPEPEAESETVHMNLT